MAPEQALVERSPTLTYTHHSTFAENRLGRFRESDRFATTSSSAWRGRRWQWGSSRARALPSTPPCGGQRVGQELASTRRVYIAVIPPSTNSNEPVTYDASLDA